jgi:hypothetical protein
MKVTLTNESAGAFFERPLAERPLARTTAVDRSNHLTRDGLTLTPWADATAVWRTALTQLRGAAFYHCEPWIEALCASYPLNLEVATLHRAGQLRAGAVLARSRGLFSTRLVSLPFTDYAAPLAIDDQARMEFLRVLASSGQADAVEIRGAEGPSPWKNVECFSYGMLDLQRPYSEISAGFSRSVRSGIKRALKDRVQIDRGTGADYLARFFELQLETRRRLGVPPQPYKFFASVHEKFGRTGDCEVWFATLNGRDEAGLVLLRSGDRLCYKWGARLERGHPGANHLLVTRMIEAHAGRAASMDFGRCDLRNQGLLRSKAELGCVMHPLPYAFFPRAPRHVSAEILSGPAKVLSAVWKRLPLSVTRVLGEAVYRYLT